MTLDDNHFDSAVSHHHEESEPGSFGGRKVIKAGLGLDKQWRQIWVSSQDFHGRSHRRTDGHEGRGLQSRSVLSKLKSEVDQRDADQHCTYDLTDRADRFPIHSSTSRGSLHDSTVKIRRSRIRVWLPLSNRYRAVP